MIDGLLNTIGPITYVSGAMATSIFAYLIIAIAGFVIGDGAVRWAGAAFMILSGAQSFIEAVVFWQFRPLDRPLSPPEEVMVLLLTVKIFALWILAGTILGVVSVKLARKRGGE